MVLRLKGSSVERFARFASRAYPREAVGVLVCDDRGVAEIVPVEKAKAGLGETMAWVSVSLRKMKKIARARGKHLIGYVHSHPDASFCPSDADMEISEEMPMFVYWGIMSVRPIGVRAEDGWPVPAEGAKGFQCSLRFWRRLPKARVEIVR